MTVAVIHAVSPEGRQALRSAATAAGEKAQPLTVLHVLSGSQDARAAAAEAEAVRREVDAELTRSGAAAQAPAYDLRTAPPGSDPGAALVELVEASGAELVVLGSRRRSPVGKFLLGGTTQRVLLDVEVPVLVVKAPQD